MFELLWYKLLSLTSFCQLACHWKQGSKTKLEWPSEDGNLHQHLFATHGPPDQPHFPDPSHASTSPVN